jgi:hypothetical protein
MSLKYKLIMGEFTTSIQAGPKSMASARYEIVNNDTRTSQTSSNWAVALLSVKRF